MEREATKKLQHPGPLKTLHKGERMGSYDIPKLFRQFMESQITDFLWLHPYALNVFKCSICWRPFRMSIIESFLKSSLIIRIVSMDKCLSIKQNLMDICCECDSHTLHKLTQWCITANKVTSWESVHACTVRYLLIVWQVISKPLWNVQNRWILSEQISL